MPLVAVRVRTTTTPTRRGSGSVRPPSTAATATSPRRKGARRSLYTPSAGDLGMWLKAKVTYDRRNRYGPDRPEDHAGSRCCGDRRCPTRASLITMMRGFSYYIGHSPRHAPVRAAVHDRTRPARLPAGGSAPLTLRGRRNRGRDVGGVCRRRRQAGGSSRLRLLAQYRTSTMRLILSRSSSTPTVCISSPVRQVLDCRLANDSQR